MVDIIPDAAVRKAMNEINAGIMPFLYMWELPPGYAGCEMFTELCSVPVKFKLSGGLMLSSVDMLPFFISSK
jgi:hypothetical protein